jgi:putative two-component system response regulator
MNVLVVDDDAITRQFLAYTLRNAGYTVSTAKNGAEAFERFLIDPYQLIVSDWNMPEMNGLDLCRAVRRADCRSYVYFILLTTHDRPEDAIAGLGAGADDYVRKPVDPGELIMRVNAGQRVINLETRGLTIFALAKLAESRDPETGEHLERVRNYCRLLSRTMGEIHPKYAGTIDDNYTQLIYETSPLHDIGKVAIPDSILLKPGRLTPDEFAIMKTHTLRGAEAIAAMRSVFPNASFLEMAHAIILSHHEKYDGGGYPHGLAGENIPLCSRIMAVADVYDALTSVRVYKAAYSHDEAARIIVGDSGRHFDPDVVAAFEHCAVEFDRLRARLSETHAAPPSDTSPPRTIASPPCPSLDFVRT